MFDNLDLNKDGKVTAAELRPVLSTGEVGSAVIISADGDGDAGLDLDEFVDWLESRHPPQSPPPALPLNDIGNDDFELGASDDEGNQLVTILVILLLATLCCASLCCFILVCMCYRRNAEEDKQRRPTARAKVAPDPMTAAQSAKFRVSQLLRAASDLIAPPPPPMERASILAPGGVEGVELGNAEVEESAQANAKRKQSRHYSQMDPEL